MNKNRPVTLSAFAGNLFMLRRWLSIMGCVVLLGHAGAGMAQEMPQPGISQQQVQGEDAERLIDSFLRGELAPTDSKTTAGAPQQVPEVIFETTALLADGSFEQAASGLPRDWTVEPADATCSVDRSEPALLGNASLRCAPGGNSPARVLSPLLALDPETVTLSSQVMSCPGSGRAVLRFQDSAGNLVGETALRAFPGQGAWVRHRLTDTPVPPGANAARLALESTEPTRWDGAEVTANCEHKPRCAILLNPLGYESIGPKVFVVSANFSAGSARFLLRDPEGREVWSSGLGAAERVIGGGGFDWGAWFYPGDFTDFQDEGTFTLAVDLDGVTAEIPGVVVAFDRYWQTLFPACVDGLARLGAEAPDDAFWRDPGDSGADQSLLFYHLAADYRNLLWRMRRPDAPEGFTRECARCAALATARLDRAGVTPETSPDEALYRLAAGLLILARYHPDVKAEAGLFAPLLEAARHQESPSPWLFSFAWHYRQLFGDPSVDPLLKTLNPGIRLEILDELLEAESENALDDTSVTVEIGAAASSVSATIVARSRGVFGLYQAMDKPAYRFFPLPVVEGQPCPGNSRIILEAAEYMARCYRFAARPEYLQFICNQVDWVLGRNPLHVCVVSGLAREQGPSEAVSAVPVPAGIVLEGIGARGPQDDRPWFPESNVETASNRNPSLTATFHLLNTLAHLKRIRVQMPDEKKR